jgi:hypothetical protein
MRRKASQQTEGTSEHPPLSLAATTLGLCMSAALSSQASPLLGAMLPSISSASVAVPSQTPRTHSVLNCEDSGSGSLRDTIQNVAQSGDTIDLSTLNCSVISLSNGEVAIAQDDLSIVSLDHPLTISGGGHSRVFRHQGTGTLAVRGITIRDGAYQSIGALPGYGGCIYSNGSVRATNTTIEDCVVSATSGGGGAIYAHGVLLDHSVVSSSKLTNCLDPQFCFGGGVFSRGTFVSKYSTVTLNDASYGSAGGVVCQSALITGTTLDHNSASYSGALQAFAGPVTIEDSTLSYNISSSGGSAMFVGSSSELMIVGSTIADNHVRDSAPPNCLAAVCVSGNDTQHPVTVRSSIIAANTDGSYLPNDLHFDDPVNGVTGADNLIIATNTVVSGFVRVSADPKLGPLQWNGGPTQTHQLLPGSPAIAMGDNTAQFAIDQRGTGYPRTTGPNASADIGAVQFDEIFVWRD